MAPNRLRPGDSRQALAVWLVVVLLTGAITIVGIDHDNQSPTPPPSLQVRPSTAAAVAPLRRRESTATARKSGQLIRVNVTPGGVKSLRLQVRGPYKLLAIDTGEVLSRGDGLVASQVQVTGGSLRIGGSTYRTTQLQIVAESDPGIEVDNHLYRGTIRLHRRTDGLVSAVNVLPIDEYLASVVDSEMPAAFPAAAREAQAIVSRTYALYHIEHANPAAVYDLFSSQRSQKYLGFEYTSSDGRRLAGESDSSRKAVAETKGLVCTWQGQVFCTYYSAVCGGRTTNGAELFDDAAPPLKSVPCEWCRASQYYRWTAQIDRRDFLNKVEGTAPIHNVSSIKQIAGSNDGTIPRFRISSTRKSFEVSGVELRERFPAAALRSPHLILRLEQDAVIAEGRGHGHGVGFCQWGARGQALAGRTATNIVRYYYPGAEVSEFKQ